MDVVKAQQFTMFQFKNGQPIICLLFKVGTLGFTVLVEG